MMTSGSFAATVAASGDSTSLAGLSEGIRNPIVSTIGFGGCWTEPHSVGRGLKPILRVRLEPRHRGRKFRHYGRQIASVLVRSALDRYGMGA